MRDGPARMRVKTEFCLGTQDLNHGNAFSGASLLRMIREPASIGQHLGDVSGQTLADNNRLFLSPRQQPASSRVGHDAALAGS